MSSKSVSLDRLLIRAKSLAKQGKYHDARKIFHETLENFPTNKRAINGLKDLGLLLARQTDDISAPFPQALIGEMISLYRTGNLVAALGLASRIEADYPSAAVLHDIKGTIYVRQRAYGKAIASYLQAVDVDPGYAEGYNNLSNAYRVSGDIAEALSSCWRALEIKPNYAQAVTSLLLLTIQENEPTEFDDEILDRLSKTDLYTAICLAIRSFVDGDLDGTKEKIDKIKPRMTEDALERLGPLNRVFVAAFVELLGELCDIHREIGTTVYQPGGSASREFGDVYHIGESHCLSFAHQIFTIGGTARIVRPRLIFGAKAWHLADRRINAYKAHFERHVAKIPDDAVVFLSFGEIDCRTNEGIVAHYLGHGGDLDRIVAETVAGYVAFTDSCFDGKTATRYYFGVPAPILYDIPADQPSNIHELQIAVVRDFNRVLKSELESRGLGYVDSYSLTANAEGSSNNKHMCDARHLSPKSLSAIVGQFQPPL